MVHVRGLVLLGAVLGLLVGCQPRGCQSTQSTQGASLGACELVRVLGERPKWSGSCESADVCFQMNVKRLHWAKCVGGRCLLGTSRPEKGHLFPVLSMLYPSESLLLSGDQKGEIRAWNPQTGRTFSRWKAHTGPVRALALDPKGWLFSAGDDELVRVWWWGAKGPYKRGQLLASLPVRGRISRMVFARRSGWLVAASTDRALWVRRWRSLADQKGKWRRWLGHTDAVRSVSFRDDEARLLSASDDRSVKMWEVPSGRLLRTFVGHKGWVRQAVFGPKGGWLASASFDLTIRLWSEVGKPLQRWGEPVDPFALLAPSASASLTNKRPMQKKSTPKNTHRSDISDLAVSPDGRWLLATGHRSSFMRLPDDGTTARLWSRKRGQVRCHLKGHQRGLTRARFSPTGAFFATASEDGTIRLYRQKPSAK